MSRWDVLDLRRTAIAWSAAVILDPLAARMPFPITLLTLPPRSPKLNDCVERATRTHTEEFSKVADAEATVAGPRPGLLEWETVYNTVRPTRPRATSPRPSIWHPSGSMCNHVTLLLHQIGLLPGLREASSHAMG